MSQDDLWRVVASFLSPQAVVRLGWSCKRFQKILVDPKFLSGYIAMHGAPDAVTTLEQLVVYNELNTQGILQENRLGFSMGSLEIDDDDDENSTTGEQDDDENTKVYNSHARMETIRGLLRRHKNLHVTIEAHCGTAAPQWLAGHFSLSRGQAVGDAVVMNHEELSLGSFTVNGWGRRVADRAARSTHRFGDLARSGKGWAELYVELDGMEFPPHPDFYSGASIVGRY